MADKKETLQDKPLGELQPLFIEQEDEIRKLLHQISHKAPNEYLETVKRGINVSVYTLQNAALKWCKEQLPKAWQTGLENHKQTVVNLAGQKTELDTKTRHIFKELEIPESEAFQITNTYAELSDSIKHAGQSLISRVNALTSGKELFTITKISDALQKGLSEQGLLYVEYDNGAKFGLDAYANMVSRSAYIETVNNAAFSYLIQSGQDLVRMTEIAVTCPICAMYQGRVYSLSGEDKRYPALFQTALSKGYKLVHPNCRHEFIPFNEDFYEKSELHRIKETSNQRFVDSRAERQRKAYQTQQELQKRARQEFNDYNEMKAEMGADMPYKTLGGYRRAVRRK